MSSGNIVTSSLDAWLTNKSVTFEKVKGWIETNGLTTATTGFAKLHDTIGSVTTLSSLITIAKASAQNSEKLAFRVALLNIRDSRNDPKFGDGFLV